MDEKKLVSIAKPYLDKCRAGDWNHALRVVKWVKILGEGRDDLDILIAAAYIHDIGWTNIFPEGKVDFDLMLKYENQANDNTPKYVREVLEQIDFDNDSILKVIRLIGAADNHESGADDEAIIVDADSLSKLCVEHVKEKYTEESFKKVVDLWVEEFPERIKTDKAKNIFPDLLVKLQRDLSL